MTNKPGLTQSVAAALALAACGGALGQNSNDTQPTNSTGGVRAPLAPRIPSLGGVKAQIPGPSGISRKGTLLNRNGTLLPPPPTSSRPPQQAGPRPRPTISTGRPDLDGRPIHIGPDYIAHPGHINSGTGVVIDGHTSGDHWNLRFHLGSGYTYSPWWNPWQRSNYRWDGCYVRTTCGQWWYPWVDTGYRSYYTTPLVYGPVDPYVLTGVSPAAMYAAAYNAQAAQQQAQPAREPTPLEKADALLMYGESKMAAEAYRKYLEDAPDDAAAMRSLAIALLDQRRFDEAVAVVAMAYEKQPRLARTPIDPSFFGDAAGLRRRLNAAVTYANRVNSGSAWLLVASLMQTEGRDDVALRMVSRARDAGLAESVAGELADVLKKN